MADEQPGHINRDVRDVAKVPQVEDLVRNNVGSTVRDNSKFKAVSEVLYGYHRHGCMGVRTWYAVRVLVSSTKRLPCSKS